MADPRRRAWVTGWGLASATLLGFALRRWPWGRLGLDQFDEGIYCLAAARLARTGSIDPGLIPYAPPGYPTLVAVASSLSGGEPPGNLVSALAGSVTIPIAGLVAGSLFGRAAAIVTAWSLCLAGPHIAFSRMALTDASFLAIWMIGFAASIAFVRRPSWSTGLLMGVTVGLAQQVKYNGWLLGAAVVLASIGGLLRREERHPGRWVRLFGTGLVGAGGAALIVLPWYLFVESHGGYAGLLRHQRSYLDAPGLWWPNLQSQANQAVALAIPWPLLGIGAFILFLSLRRIARHNDRWSWRSEALVLIAVLVVIGWLVAPIVVGLVLLPRLMRDPDPGRRLVATTWLLLGVLTPFYHPYARLWLPFEGMHWILLGGLVTSLVDPSRPLEADEASFRGGVIWLGLVVLATVVGPWLRLPILGEPGQGGPRLFQPSNGLEELAGRVAERLSRPNPRLLTLVRPALTYSLSQRVELTAQESIEQIQRRGDRSAWVLLDSTVTPGEVAIRDGRRSIDRLEGWELSQEFVVPLTLPTALDLDPRRQAGPRPTEARFWLLQPRTRSSPP